ncbi:hypothetical protein ACFYM0_32865 [Streptomyces sp. NPDC006487]|uniref:hypothetical protein n=1 Tax=Streptomyces sp. NPDC006487 TaxID=3364748 RepID=UPI003689D149
MSTSQSSRRTLLTAALALPAAAAAGPLLATPATATGTTEVGVAGGWRQITVTSGAGIGVQTVPQFRIVQIAGTGFLQLRGTITGTFDTDFLLGTLPADVSIPTTARDICPRNNVNGLTTCRVEVNAQRQVWIHGANTNAKITWLQLDNFSAA